MEPSFKTFSLKDKIKYAFHSFSKKQLKVFLGFFLLALLGVVSLLYTVNEKYIVSIPAYGGSLSEGIIGTPRFVNPLLAISDADSDLTSLVYSGLMKKNTKGDLVPDLAKSYTVSDDGLTYTFTLKPEIFFQDKTRITADDVLFTIGKAQDGALKSPKQVSWAGVTVTKIDDNTISFTLKHTFASFLENTTIGILPSHIWENIPIDEWSYSDFNTSRAVGSGPYQISSVNRNSAGIPGSYSFIPFKKYVGGSPFIKNLTMQFFANEKDLIAGVESGSVDQTSGVSPSGTRTLANNGFEVKTTVLPRIFGIFFNQTQAPIFTDHSIMKAFDLAINKNQIIKNALYGYGEIIDSPLPSDMLPEDSNPNITDTYNPDEAMSILNKAGWTKGSDGIMTKRDAKTKKVQSLSFSLATGDSKELETAAREIGSDLEKIGVKVNIQIFEMGQLNQNVIRPRKYDALFFGEIINHDSDLFAFWHSSQIKDPGLNVAMYANPKTDKLLESAQASLDDATRKDKLTQFANEIEKDSPAVFIYSPQFTYVISNNAHNISINNINTPEDRFATIKDWYTREDRVWKIFAKSNLTALTN